MTTLMNCCVTMIKERALLVPSSSSRLEIPLDVVQTLHPITLYRGLVPSTPLNRPGRELCVTALTFTSEENRVNIRLVTIHKQSYKQTKNKELFFTIIFIWLHRKVRTLNLNYFNINESDENTYSVYQLSLQTQILK